MLEFNSLEVQEKDVAQFLKSFHLDISLSQIHLDVLSIGGDNPEGPNGNSGGSTDMQFLFRTMSSAAGMVIADGSETSDLLDAINHVVGVTDFTSGAKVASAYTNGGFSNIFPREDYQPQAVSSYLTQTSNLNASLYNNTGRGYPDVALVADDIMVSQTSTVIVFSHGTAMVVPIIVAIITRLNQLCANEGKSSLGFINLLIYSNATALNNITQGSNPGTNGFSAKLD
ncbi:hypothetical protein Clacol_006093 [Clathrus columnatus]|uniref:Peptidase S53 domain-containing protein n=1 Tax=Clathrus columnatus TaxID=1419009 RepID=A0AAV5AG28_9AGAM|nr:hypothetical protein Clacol_006093 [Clathrus columnatus]